MRILIVAVVIGLPLGDARSQILHDDVLYIQGKQMQAVKSDTILSRDALRLYEKDRPNAPVFGYIVGARLSKDLQFLNIRCVVKTGREPLRQVLARLVVESYDSEYFSYWQLDTFNIAIVDTIPSNEIRTYIFKHHLDVLRNTGSQMVWNHYRQSSNPKSFRWLFEPVFIRRSE